MTLDVGLDVFVVRVRESQGRIVGMRLATVPAELLRFLALRVGGVENVGAKAILPLEGKQFLFQRVDVGQQFSSAHKLAGI